MMSEKEKKKMIEAMDTIKSICGWLDNSSDFCDTCPFEKYCDAIYSQELGVPKWWTIDNEY